MDEVIVIIVSAPTPAFSLGVGNFQDVGVSTLGVRFAWETTLGGTRIVLRASFAWQHALARDVDDHGVSGRLNWRF
ncbi:hypothetical protein [Hyphomicrobium sp.]|uniref:hypothetical protein n=1 Tax=Hyphomicrobium sp. TaxID=82 RepID=UPI002B98D8C6|nr:hypothetical protein [Hyphomicrobium sp.]HRN87474.1 hypothetical protein [Hyphomicrobium sp.]HRQ26198.1 hypothetical protein [Hyphomicrobium sp.]